jgi:uncharacterized protein
MEAGDDGVYAALFKCGYMCDCGVGVEQDYEEAMVWYVAAADMGSTSAMHNMGLIHLSKEKGYHSPAEAVKWFKRSAEAGDSQSQTQLGKMYLEGTGVEPDRMEAARWLTMAAQQGDENAVKLLEKM